MYHEEYSILWEHVPYVKLLQNNQTYLYWKLNGYGDNDKILKNGRCYTFIHIKMRRNL
jgi:hypothetical protein